MSFRNSWGFNPRTIGVGITAIGEQVEGALLDDFTYHGEMEEPVWMKANTTKE